MSSETLTTDLTFSLSSTLNNVRSEIIIIEGTFLFEDDEEYLFEDNEIFLFNE